MYIDGYLLFAIYFIAVLALAVSVYAVWSLEEIRQYYAGKQDSTKRYQDWKSKSATKVARAKGHWD